MRGRLLGFVGALRGEGLTPSPAETLDAMRAVARLGVERPVLREALAATLVKDHADRAVFEAVFERYFAVPPRQPAKGKRPAPSPSGDGVGRGGQGNGRKEDERPGTAARRRDEAGSRPAAAARSTAEEERSREAAVRLLAERRALMVKPFRDMDAREVESLRVLVAELSRRLRARWSRRFTRARRGGLDWRRTLRRALSRGGVPVELLGRMPRPGKVDLLALVDLSYSTATAAEFLLALLEPARGFFRRVKLFAYVDRPCPVSFERGHVVPHEPLDLSARSDFGAVLVRLSERIGLEPGRNTVVLILGDARNNRRPPRADLLRALGHGARAVVWLNPEPQERWNTGDSAVAAYAQYCGALLAAWNPRTLVRALDALMLA